MKTTVKLIAVLLILVVIACQPQQNKEQQKVEEPLSLWNEGDLKSSIITFVNNVTTTGNQNYLAIEDRIAVFDMDGTILLEKPNYVLFDFVIRKMMEQIANNPELKNKQPYKAVNEQDWAYFETLDMFAEDGLYSVLLYATDGYTNAEYTNAVHDYFKTVKDKRYGVSYNKLVYAPVVQLVEYLQENDFQVYIVSGSDPQFTRTFCQEAANIPETNVIGTTILTKWIETDSSSYFVRQHEFVNPINDEAGKPVNILNKIGKTPVFAVGNSTGDYHMLEYSKNAKYSMQLIVNHDDAEREYDYKAEKMKKLCLEKGWLEISMKKEFKTIFEGL